MDIPKSTNGQCEEEKSFETTNSIAEPPTGTICQKDNNFESISMEQSETINEPNPKTDLDELKNQNFHPNFVENSVSDGNNIVSHSHDDGGGQNGIIENKISIDQPGINNNDNNCSTPTNNDEFNNILPMVKQTIPLNIPTPSTNNNNNNNSHTNKRKSDYQIESNIDEKKVHNMRRNIRGVINETNFDTITINAQREESERLARVQGLKKLVKQKYLHSALESMVEGVHEVQDDDFLAACEPVEAPSSQLQIKKTTFDLKDKLQRLEEKKSDKIHWNQWLSAEAKDPPVKKEEVVTIDSSSEDDDCIILSDSDEDCLDDEAEDHHNSGLHVRDVLNIPNEHGKVMVNVGHVDSEPDIFLAPQIAAVIKPHQIGGVRFLFDNIIESTKRFNTSSGFGCILAHSMGLGKTLQLVSFSDIFLRHTDSKTILCVMPINTIQNWVKEYNMWIPEESPDPERIRPRNFKVFALNDQHKTMSSRSKVIARWYAEGGVLLIGYELFRVLGLKIIKRRDGKKNLESNEHKKLLDNMHAALVKPGPDLVICDEGHRIKNAHAGISIALKQIRTRRRIVLTGYPLQNNLLEYWCMVDFVRPNYLGSKTEFCNMFERPIQNGQCIDSTPEDIKLMRYRAHVLHSLLLGFVQRRSDSVLQNSLPQKLEYVILTKMTKFQRQLYDAFMNEVVRKKKVPNPLKAFAVCCKIWNHPDVLYNFVKKRESDLDLDIDEQDTKPKAGGAKSANEFGPLNVFGNEAFPSTATGMNFQGNSSSSLWTDGEANPVVDAQQHPKLVGMLKGQPPLSNTAKCSSEIVDMDTKEVQFVKSDLNVDLEVSGNIQSSGSFENQANAVPPAGSAIASVTKPIVKMETRAGNDTISYDWAIALIKDYEPGIVSTSPKMQIFIHILEESIKVGDRVLVFSQSLLTLNLMEQFLQGLIIPESDKHWKKNVSYFRLDGSTSSLEREKLVNEFNSNIEVKLFLISTRAGSLGINLTGANRVVVFDASWNPCHDTQAVHRIYRYGQGKPCFVYRIVMDNCLEKNIYDRQVKKQGMSDRVVDECNPDAHLSIKELTNLCYDKAEEDENAEFKQPIENYTDDIMRSMLTQHKSILSKEPFYHESLLIDRKEKKLSQTEKKLAKRGYEIEKKASTKPHHFIHNIHNVHNMVQNRDCMINKVNTQQIFKNRIVQPFNKNNANIKMTRWIPAEVWQRQGMSSQEMKLPIDVAIPTNSNDSSNIVVKAGEKVMVLNSPKGVYMQLESGKIIAIKTSAEAAKDKMLQAKKLASSQLMEKKNFKEVACRATNDQASEDSENDDCIVINDNINDSSDNSSFDLSYTSPKNRTEITPVKQQQQQQQQHQKPKLTTPIQTFPKNMPTVPPEAPKDKSKTANQPQLHQQQQPPPPPPLQSATTIPATTTTTTNTNHQYQKDKEDPQIQRNLYVHEKSNQLMPHSQDKLEPVVNFAGSHTTDIAPQIHQFPHENPHHAMRIMDKQPAEPIIPNHHSFETKPKLEPAPSASASNNYIHKQNSYMYGNSSSNHSNYDMIPAQHNMVENQHYQAMAAAAAAAPQRWDNKSPDLYKQAFKISNIPAPYPSTAVCDLSLFEKNEKSQHPISNESVNAEHYSSRPSYPPVCKPTEEPPYHHNLNYNLNYQNNNPHASIMQPPPPLPPTEDNGSLNALYHYNNKNENTYSEHLYDNPDASTSSSTASASSAHTNYHQHHQQMSKYSYGYYQPPPYLPNYASAAASSNNSNKPYDNNTFPSVSNPYSYMRRPAAAYSANSMNGVDVGYNYAEHQGWMKKHLPE